MHSLMLSAAASCLAVMLGYAAPADAVEAGIVVSLVPVLLLHGIIVAGRPRALASQRGAASVKGIREAPGAS